MVWQRAAPTATPGHAASAAQATGAKFPLPPRAAPACPATSAQPLTSYNVWSVRQALVCNTAQLAYGVAYKLPTCRLPTVRGGGGPPPPPCN